MPLQLRHLARYRPAATRAGPQGPTFPGTSRVPATRWKLSCGPPMPLQLRHLARFRPAATRAGPQRPTFPGTSRVPATRWNSSPVPRGPNSERLRPSWRPPFRRRHRGRSGRAAADHSTFGHRKWVSGPIHWRSRRQPSRGCHGWAPLRRGLIARRRSRCPADPRRQPASSPSRWRRRTWPGRDRLGRAVANSSRHSRRLKNCRS